MPATVFTEMRNSAELFAKLATNPNMIIMKFSAEWCAPCKKITPTVHNVVEKLPEDVHFYDIDVDENMEIYGFLRTKKMLNGIPAILCWKKGNVNFVPDNVIIGGDVAKVEEFFRTLFPGII